MRLSCEKAIESGQHASSSRPAHQVGSGFLAPQQLKEVRSLTPLRVTAIENAPGCASPVTGSLVSLALFAAWRLKGKRGEELTIGRNEVPLVWLAVAAIESFLA
jgi:hypothetical protein